VLSEFTNKFVHQVKQLKVGNGLDDDVQIGPMISNTAAQNVHQLVKQSVDAGARIVAGGKEPKNNYYAPTVITQVTNSMSVAKSEIFGPVSPIIGFDTEQEVVAMANDTEYGLAAYFYARDIGRVWRVAEQLQYGMVGINEGIISNAVAPFGGVKQSGNGREGSKYGLDDYLEIKYVCMGGMNA
jgi:succinate-semialdehyde dehydrogenase/glutarate-semialdehyde dehydrogenase